MRVFVAGATGAIGRPLVERLVQDGHEVWGLTRSEDRATALEALGAHGVVADALDRDAVLRAVGSAAPDAVIQQLTALPQQVTPTAMAEGYAQTSRLRTEGTRHLLDAAPTARHVVQSIAFSLRPEGDWVKDEDAPLFTDAPEPMGGVSRRLGEMEDAVVAAGGVVLRYGFFYGPGTWYHRDGAIGEMLLKRRYPVIKPGTARWSWLHVEDAVSATVAALQGGAPGVYNVVDDQPAPAAAWIPAMAEALGAKRPRRVPAWLAKRVAGPMAVYYANEVRGASNARFKRTFGWEPRHPDWRQGFRTTLG